MHPPQRLTQPLVKASLRSTFKLSSRTPLPLSLLRAGMELGAGLFMARRDVSSQTVTLGTQPALCIRPRAVTPSSSKRVLLHLHGGAFFAGSSNTHYAMATELAARCHATVYLLDYRRAPEYVYPAALDDALNAYHALFGQGWMPEQIFLAGDSGGCAHVLSAAVALRDQGSPLPAGLVMLSPFVDLNLSMPSVTDNAKRDPMLSVNILKRGADAYRGKLALNDPRISPLFAPLHDLPPMLIHVGSEEILLDDARQLAERVQDAGGTVECQVYQGMWHNFQMFNQLISDAENALDQIGQFVRTTR